MFAIAGVLLLIAVGLMIIQTRIVRYPFLKYPFIYGSVVATLLAVVFATALGNDFPIHIDLTLVQPTVATTPAARQTISFVQDFPAHSWSVGQHTVLFSFKQCPGSLPDRLMARFEVTEQAMPLTSTVYIQPNGLMTTRLQGGLVVAAIHPAQPTAVTATFVDLRSDEAQRFAAACEAFISWDDGPLVQLIFSPVAPD